jgi:hypothetical protein
MASATARSARVRLSLAAVMVVVAVWAAACSSTSQITESPFERVTSDVAATLSSAAATLEKAHTGELTFPYAAGAFVDYRGKLEGISDTLATLSGAPDSATVDALRASLDKAQPALDEPCVQESCDWQTQLAALRAAADSFDQASKTARS